MFSRTFSFPVTTLADRRRVVRCRNLRPLPSGGLCAVGRPRTVACFESGTPVAVRGGCFTLHDGTRCVLMYHDGYLKAVVEAGDGGMEVMTVCRMDAAPSCAIGIDDGVIVMPAEGEARRFAFVGTGDGGGWSETRLFPSLPPLMIVRRDMGTAVSSVPALSLRSAYSTTSQHLSDTDQDIVDKAMREAYVRLSDGALLRGRYIQPVVARYRLIGDGGRVLYTSAPVIVAPQAGLQGVTATLALTGDGFRQVAATSLSAVEFVPEIEYTRTPDAAWEALVRSVELLVSPQLHPYSATLPGYTSKSGATATQLTLTARLPGVDPLRQSAAASTRMAVCVAAILDNADTALQPLSLPADTLSELSRLQSIASIRPVAATAETALAVNLSAPHTFNASAVARSGDLVAWGGLTVNPFDGYSLPEMAIAASSGQSAVPTAVKVTMHDGSSVVRTAVMTGSGEPVMSPLLVYPSADAVEMTLLAGSKALTVPLTPTPCGRAAYYLSPDLRPLALAEERGGFVVPSASPRRRHYPSAIAVCPVATPFDAVAVSYGDGTSIQALLPALRHSNSFTVPSARFYLFGAGGILSMTLSDNRKRVNLNLLDSRSVSSPRAVTPMAGGVAAIAGGALVTVTGARPTTLLEHCQATMLGWSDRYGELWCMGGDGEDEAVIAADDGAVLYTRAGIGIADAVSTGTGMILVTASGQLLDTSAEEDAEVSVCHASTIGHSFSPGTCATLLGGIFGEAVSGTIALEVSHGAPERAGATLRTLTITGGDLNHPLCEPVRLPHSHLLALTISLTTSHPSKLHISEP